VTAVNAEKKRAEDEGIPYIFLNAGDTFQGTLWYNVYKWEVVAPFIEMLGLDAMVRLLASTARPKHPDREI